MENFIQREAREKIMKNTDTDLTDELRPEYDLSHLTGRVRGKYVERYQSGTNLIRLEPDVAQAFSDPKAVNEALRLLIKLAQTQVIQTGRLG